MTSIRLILLSLLLSSMAYSQGSLDGFYQGKGNLVTVVGFGFEDTKNYFAGTTRTDFGRNLYSFSAFASYGILEDLDMQVSIPFLISNKQSDFQDMQIGVKYRLLRTSFTRGNFELSAGGGFSFNLTDYRLGGLNDLGQQAKIIDTRLIAHYTRDSGWFGTLNSGFSFKLAETPNSFPLVLKIGRATAKLYFDFWYDLQHSFGGIDYLGTPRPQNFREFGVSYHKIGGTVYIPFTPASGIFFAPSYLVAGRNAFQGPSYHLGWVYRIPKKDL